MKSESKNAGYVLAGLPACLLAAGLLAPSRPSPLNIILRSHSVPFVFVLLVIRYVFFNPSVFFHVAYHLHA